MNYFYFHDLLFPCPPFGWFTHKGSPLLPIIWYQNTEGNYHWWDNIQELQNSLVFIWCDMLQHKLLPWFFYLSMFIELYHFGQLTIIGTFWAITHVVIWCYHWIMHKSILTFRIFCEMLLCFTVSVASRWMNYENSSSHAKSFPHTMHLCKNIECQHL